mmetsp:Transcript_13784/g.29731  ORF Transcript_13784/g.29731 Transcript_13784/m.29731 type:complete len:108 (+) Transcript_13784:35-358(+)
MRVCMYRIGGLCIDRAPFGARDLCRDKSALYAGGARVIGACVRAGGASEINADAEISANFATQTPDAACKQRRYPSAGCCRRICEDVTCACEIQCSWQVRQSPSDSR